MFRRGSPFQGGQEGVELPAACGEVTGFAEVAVETRDREESKNSPRSGARPSAGVGEEGGAPKVFGARGQGCCLFNLHNASLLGPEDNVQGQVLGFSAEATVPTAPVFPFSPRSPSRYMSGPVPDLGLPAGGGT